ncbi:hypothetical protein [Flavobacterium columnare]|nr:hypothetical protein [Flavobacterium columnare]
MERILYIENFISQPQNLFQHLEGITWDERMISRYPKIQHGSR